MGKRKVFPLQVIVRIKWAIKLDSLTGAQKILNTVAHVLIITPYTQPRHPGTFCPQVNPKAFRPWANRSQCQVFRGADSRLSSTDSYTEWHIGLTPSGWMWLSSRTLVTVISVRLNCQYETVILHVISQAIVPYELMSAFHSFSLFFVILS